MISGSPEWFNRALYLVTIVIGMAGFVAAWPWFGLSSAAAFALGAAASVGSLFLFDYLAKAISPEGAAAKPWQGRAFMTRYLLLFAGGYTIVKALGVNPLAVILGLLSSAAAAILLIVFELLETLLRRTPNR